MSVDSSKTTPHTLLPPQKKTETKTNLQCSVFNLRITFRLTWEKLLEETLKLEIKEMEKAIKEIDDSLNQLPLAP